MPDEQGNPTEEELAAQEKQLEQLRTWVQDEAKKSFEEQQKANEKHNDAESAAKDPLAEVIGQYTDPKIQRAEFIAASAMDLANFYDSNPEARAMKSEIEATFNELANAGRPTDRRKVYAYLQGEKVLKDKDAFINEEIARREKQKQEAAEAVDAGAFSLSKLLVDRGVKDPSELSHEELTKALEGVSF
jgi:hypothetical protein